jgi:NADPH2:quinone reductase
MYGQVSGSVPAFETARLIAGGSLYLTRTSLFHYVRSRKELLSRVNDLFGWVISGELTVHINGSGHQPTPDQPTRTEATAAPASPANP